MILNRTAILCCFLPALLVALSTNGLAQSPKKTSDFETKIQPFLKQHCTSCHNQTKNSAGIILDHYTSENHAKKDRKVWEAVQQQIAEGQMPPKKKPQPSKEQKDFVLGWIENSLLKVDCVGPRDPGRVTLRRLNRVEYNNTIRDLFGINYKPADNFPSDDVGYGFDNIGDVLSMPPILFEKYLAAADQVLEQSISNSGRIRSSVQNFQPQNLNVIPRFARTREVLPNGREIRRIVLTEEGSAFLEKFNFPAEGEYILRARAWGKSEDKTPAKLVIRLDGKDLKTEEVEAEQGKGKMFEVKTKVSAGERRVAVAFVNPAEDKKSRKLGIEAIQIEGPIGGGSRALTESEKKIIVKVPMTVEEERPAAEVILKQFARNAFRRPVTKSEIDRLVHLYDLAIKQGDDFEVAIRLPLKAVLVSPHFLFRVEADPKNPNEARILNDHELAVRLSYFLWSTMPDAELFRLADEGKLHDKKVLHEQVRRMLKDSKSVALTDNFAGQWLMLRNIANLTPDSGTYPTWDEFLRTAIVRETEMFFDHIVKEDRSVLEFLDSNYTFANERLARHYGLSNVRGREFRKVELPDSRRGGLVTHASILLVTSNPTRTSPVKRGKWVYENILGLTAPPPAPDVPELEKVALKGTLRQRMEQHRANPSCASCHAKLDPLGFGLENFDGIGKWRDTDEGHKIDSSGVLPDGAKFAGPAELKKVLLGKSELFRRCLAEKLLTFSLGRGLDYYDKCVLDELVLRLRTNNDRFSELVIGIVDSDPFQKRRGKRSD